MFSSYLLFFRWVQLVVAIVPTRFATPGRPTWHPKQGPVGATTAIPWMRTHLVASKAVVSGLEWRGTPSQKRC